MVLSGSISVVKRYFYESKKRYIFKCQYAILQTIIELISYAPALFSHEAREDCEMLQPGTQIEDYRIVRLFASGGMGEIYIADETSIGRQVALKVIRPEVIKYPNSEDARKMTELFRREASAIARLNHPDILPLYRFGQAMADGTPLMFMVMPYCEEKSLTDWMYKQNRTTLTPQEAEPIVRQAAEALQYAHDQGIIHLDVKPSNFLVRYGTNDPQRLNIQLADFGIAKFTGTSGVSQTVRGSLEAMAPEQWEGSPTPATDQYALAVMVYKLLTGRNPFTGTGFEQLWFQHRTMPPQPPSTINPAVPRSLDPVILRALAKNPQERFPSVLAFSDAYRQALANQNASSNIAPPPPPPPNQNLQPIRHTLMLNTDEARAGGNRVITLPTGERLSVYVPPGIQSGQQLPPIQRPGLPPVLVTANVLANAPVNAQSGMQPPLAKTQLANSGANFPPLEKTQLAHNGSNQGNQGNWGGQSSMMPPPPSTYQPNNQPRPNRTRTLVLGIIAVLIIVVAIISIFAVSSYVTGHNNQLATATAQSNQTQVATNNLNATATQSAINTIATQSAANATATAANAFPNVAGSYAGSFNNNANGQSGPLALNLQQNQSVLTGTCSIDNSPFTIQNGQVSTSGGVQFTVTIPSSSGNVVVNFVGSVQSNGGLAGTFTSSTGGQGTWTTTKQ